MQITEPHPAAEIWPMMTPERYAELVDDIRRNGQVEPITVCEGKILDGRNRLKACLELGVEPHYRRHAGDPWKFTWSVNGARRDMKAAQRGLIWKECESGSEEWQRKLADQRAEANRKRAEAAKGNNRAAKNRAKTVVGHSDPQLFSEDRHSTRKAAAKAANVSESTMKRVEQIIRHPEIAEKVKAGEIGEREAIRQIHKKTLPEKPKREPELPARVLKVFEVWNSATREERRQIADALNGVGLRKINY